MDTDGLGLSDSDVDPADEQNAAEQAMHAAGLSSDDDAARVPARAAPVSPGPDAAISNDDGHHLKDLGLDGSDDEFNDRHGDQEDEEAKQVTSGPRLLRPERNKGPPEVWEVPLIPRPEEQLRVITLKSMVDIESTPYNVDEFSLDDAITFDDRGHRILRAPVLNRIRYRFKEDNMNADKLLSMESNARIVRWDDGSLSLMIGSECVDLSEEPVEGQRMLLGIHHNDLQVVQAQQLLKSRLLLRPPAHDSNLHRNMTLNLATARHASTKVKANAVLEDFGHEHMAAVDRDREQLKLREKQNKAASRRRHVNLSDSRRPVSQRMSVPFLEADDDDDDYGEPRASLGAHEAEAQEKRLLQAKQGKRPRFHADDDDNIALSDDDKPPPHRPKRNALLDSDDEF